MKKFIAICLAAMALASCNQSAPEAIPQAQQVAADTTASAPTLVADTITYLVYIRPQDLTDEFEVAYLSGLKVDLLVDQIFDAVYKHGAQATDFQTGQVYSIDDIKTRELTDPRFAREKVSVIQFTERWFFDPVALQFKKEVLKIHVGYGIRNDAGFIEANRPGMVIDMKSI